MTKYKVYDEEGKIVKYVDTEKMTYLACDGVLNQNGCTDNETLFMTPRSKRFFVLSRSMWQGSHDSMTEVDRNNAYQFVLQCADVNGANEIIKNIFSEKETIEELE